jgi:hypothetical protein
MTDYGEKLRALGLSNMQVVTILSGWRTDRIEALLRGELSPPTDEGIVRGMTACEGR